jgi:hypothetical protein
MISDKWKSEYFCARGWTGRVALKAFVNSVFRRDRRRHCGSRHRSQTEKLIRSRSIQASTVGLIEAQAGRAGSLDLVHCHHRNGGTRCENAKHNFPAKGPLDVNRMERRSCRGGLE